MRGPIQGWRRHVAWFFASFVVAGGFLVLALAIGGALPHVDPPYKVNAVVPNAVSLAPKGEVRVAGLKVGEIAEISRRGNTAIVAMEIEDEYAPIRGDAEVGVRLRTLVGENYVELYPGSTGAPALKDGATLPLKQEREFAELDQILAELDPQTRERAGQMLRGLGQGLDGQGRNLNQTLEGLGEVIDELDPVSAVLARDNEQTSRLVDNLGSVMASISDRGDELRLMARQGRVTAEAVADRDARLRETLAELPPSLRQVRSTSNVLQGVTGTTTPALEEVTTLLREADPTARLLRPAAGEGRRVVRELGRAAPPLERTLGALRRFSRPGSAALPRVHETLREANPALEYISPYANELGAFFSNFRSSTNYFDATGNAIRLRALTSEQSFQGLDQQSYAAVKALYDTGILSEVRALGENPYPRPGDLSSPPQQFEGDHPRVQPEPKRR